MGEEGREYMADCVVEEEGEEDFVDVGGEGSEVELGGERIDEIGKGGGGGEGKGVAHFWQRAAARK